MWMNQYWVPLMTAARLASLASPVEEMTTSQCSGTGADSTAKIISINPEENKDESLGS